MVGVLLDRLVKDPKFLDHLLEVLLNKLLERGVGNGVGSAPGPVGGPVDPPEPSTDRFKPTEVYLEVDSIGLPDRVGGGPIPFRVTNEGQIVLEGSTTDLDDGSKINVGARLYRHGVPISVEQYPQARFNISYVALAEDGMQDRVDGLGRLDEDLGAAKRTENGIAFWRLKRYGETGGFDVPVILKRKGKGLRIKAVFEGIESNIVVTPPIR